MLWLSLVLKLGNFHLVYFLLKGHQFFVNRVKSKIKISNMTKSIPSGDVNQNIDIAVKMAAKYIKNPKGTHISRVNADLTSLNLSRAVGPTSEIIVSMSNN